jgi:GTP-binding protein EngB required for normal cell division
LPVESLPQSIPRDQQAGGLLVDQERLFKERSSQDDQSILAGLGAWVALNQVATESSEKSVLNQAQRLRLRVTCQYIDRLLSDVENIMHAANTRSPFGKYVIDISPGQTRVVEEFIQKLRAQLLRSLAWQGMKVEEPTISATSAVLTNLGFIDIAVEELGPRYMKGSGAIDTAIAEELRGVVYELRSLLENLTGYLRQEMGVNPEARFAQLEQAGSDVSLLRTISDIVSRHGMVEFRARINQLTASVADQTFEVALFGRVSTGKSSLLNALLGTEVLPVGVTPVTAVPTRLQWGPAPRAWITIASSGTTEVPLSGIADYVTEAGNPGNRQHVTRAVIQYPSPKIPSGVVLVDTPGLGSLAQRGTAETLSYLPAADFALLLIDAAGTVTEEDIGTLRLLSQAGIPALVLLSKSDLLSERDLREMQRYIEREIEQNLGWVQPVFVVTSLPGRADSLDSFFRCELQPRFVESLRLHQQSVQRKTAALRDAVVAAIEATLRRTGSVDTGMPQDVDALEDRLRKIMAQIGDQPRVLDAEIIKIEDGAEAILDEVAAQCLRKMESGDSTVSSLQISDWIHTAVDSRVLAALKPLRSGVLTTVEHLCEVALSLQAAEKPALEEFDSILRDLPRFELTVLSRPVQSGRWKVLPFALLQARTRSELKEAWYASLRDALQTYGRTLHSWAQKRNRTIERMISSYADTYRNQVYRLAGYMEDPVDRDQIKEDLQNLRRLGGDAA